MDRTPDNNHPAAILRLHRGAREFNDSSEKGQTHYQSN
jgi:hypothetical protein